MPKDSSSNDAAEQYDETTAVDETAVEADAIDSEEAAEADAIDSEEAAEADASESQEAADADGADSEGAADKTADGATKRTTRAKSAKGATASASKAAAERKPAARGGKGEKVGKSSTASMTKEQLRYSSSSKRGTKVRDDLNPVWFKPLMFGFLLLGLLWILVYYLSSGRIPVPALGDWNLLVGIGIAMVGFLMMTNWK